MLLSLYLAVNSKIIAGPVTTTAPGSYIWHQHIYHRVWSRHALSHVFTHEGKLVYAVLEANTDGESRAVYSRSAETVEQVLTCLCMGN